jgi:hypothetical protein
MFVAFLPQPDLRLLRNLRFSVDAWYLRVGQFCLRQEFWAIPNPLNYRNISSVNKRLLIYLVVLSSSILGPNRQLHCYSALILTNQTGQTDNSDFHFSLFLGSSFPNIPNHVPILFPSTGSKLGVCFLCKILSQLKSFRNPQLYLESCRI